MHTHIRPPVSLAHRVCSKLARKAVSVCGPSRTCVPVVVHVCSGRARVRACVCPGCVCPTVRWGANLTSFTCAQSIGIGTRHEGDPCAWDDTSSSESPSSSENASASLLLPPDAEEEDDEEEPAFDPSEAVSTPGLACAARRGRASDADARTCIPVAGFGPSRSHTDSRYAGSAKVQRNAASHLR